MKSIIQPVVARSNALQDYIVETYFQKYGVTALYWSFAFVFFYFGLQKPAPVYTPVRVPLAYYFGTLGIPLGSALLFIGFYEMTMGVLFFLKRIRIVFWMFLAHQTVAFSTLIVIPHVAFQPPWIPVLGHDFPWALAGFSAFVLKNVIFVGAFFVLASIELGDDTTEPVDA